MIVTFSAVIAAISWAVGEVAGKNEQERIEEEEKILIEMSGSPGCLPRYMQEKYFPEWLSEQKCVSDKDLFKDYLGEISNGEFDCSKDGGEKGPFPQG